VQKIKTFLMFTGNAEEAMDYYVSIFSDSRVDNITRYGAGEHGEEGTVMHATFTLNGQQFMCIDSSASHAFTFTPAISLHVTCNSQEEIEELFKKLSVNGQVLMPLEKYPFSEKYAWVNDRFGVSWQLTL
jgi:predicted 3-demethylubiquinone-9 3-methyltransferase (glyoxalase superfamily)